MPVHKFYKVIEQIAGVVRAGGSLGMILNRKSRQLLDTEAFIGIIVEIDVGELDAFTL
jgi:hypothetical protein